MTRALPLLILLLAGCDPNLPTAEATISAQARAQAFPVLLPLDPLLAQGRGPSRAAAAETDVQGRATRLTGVRIAAPAGADLAARGARLRARAAQLRAIRI